MLDASSGSLKDLETEEAEETDSESDKKGTWWVMEGRRLQQSEIISILLQGRSCVVLMLYKERICFFIPKFGSSNHFNVEFYKNISIESVWLVECGLCHSYKRTGRAQQFK